MKTIIKKQASGKTTELIKLSASTCAIIVCSSLELANQIQIKAHKELGLSIKLPITYREFIERKYAMGITGFLIDDADRFLQSLTNVKIIAISITDEE